MAEQPNEQPKGLEENSTPSLSWAGVVWENTSASDALRNGIGEKSPKQIVLPEDQYTTSGDYKVLKNRIWGMDAAVTGNSILLWNKMTRSSAEGAWNFDLIITLDNDGRIQEAHNLQGNRGHIDEKTLAKIVEDLKKQGINIDKAQK